MSIQTEKIELAKLLLSTDNPKIIQSIKQIFKKAKTSDFWDDLTPEQQNEINLATDEINEGKVTDYDSFMANHR